MNYIFIKNIADILGSKPKNMCAGIRHNENIEICKSLDCSNWPCHKFDKLTSLRVKNQNTRSHLLYYFQKSSRLQKKI